MSDTRFAFVRLASAFVAVAAVALASPAMAADTTTVTATPADSVTTKPQSSYPSPNKRLAVLVIPEAGGVTAYFRTGKKLYAMGTYRKIADVKWEKSNLGVTFKGTDAAGKAWKVAFDLVGHSLTKK